MAPRRDETIYGVRDERVLRYAWVAARLHGVPQDRFEEFSGDTIGASLSWKRAWAATRALRQRPPLQRKRGRPSTRAPQEPVSESGTPTLGLARRR
jgi:hypothetical protein